VRSISAAIRNERTTTQTDPFQATIWAVASWLIFYVAHSSRIDLDMLGIKKPGPEGRRGKRSRFSANGEKSPAPDPWNRIGVSSDVLLVA
jgi:hypothetical protein